MMKLRTLLSIFALLAGGFTAGCGNGDSKKEGAQYIDDRGQTFQLEEPPRRLIVLSPSLTEMIYALDAEDRIVGVSRYCQWPAAAQDLPQVGGGMDPDAEALLRLNPDLILSSGSTAPPALERLEEAGIPLGLLEHASISDVYADFLTLSRWLGLESRGERRVNRLKEEARELKSRVEARQMEPAPTVVILYGFSDLQSAGRNSFASDIVELAGGHNLADQTGEAWPVLSPEMLLKWNPDVILFSLNGSETEKEVTDGLNAFTQDPRWKPLKAVAGNRLYTVPDSLLSVPGPRSLKAATLVADHLYPELR